MRDRTKLRGPREERDSSTIFHEVMREHDDLIKHEEDLKKPNAKLPPRGPETKIAPTLDKVLSTPVLTARARRLSKLHGSRVRVRLLQDTASRRWPMWSRCTICWTCSQRAKPSLMDMIASCVLQGFITVLCRNDPILLHVYPVY